MTTNTDADVTLGELKERIAVFAKVRDWGQFHAPKNLAMALASEVGELMEHFLWLDIAESRHLCEDASKRAQVAEELADVLIYALRFADENFGILHRDEIIAEYIASISAYYINIPVVSHYNIVGPVVGTTETRALIHCIGII